MSLGQNIAKIRKTMGLTQEQLAEKCEVSRQAVTKWESGESEPAIAKLVKLSNVLEVSIDELIQGNSSNVCKQSNEMGLQYRDLSMIAHDLNRPAMVRTKSFILLAAELMYDVVKTKYMDSNDRVFDEYLIENTSFDERREKVKFLIVGSEFSDAPFQDYVDGKHEIDVAFEKLLERLEDKIATEEKIESMQSESQAAKKYTKVRQLLSKMCRFEDYNENKLMEIDHELQTIIDEQDEQTQFGRCLILYIKEIELAWNNKDIGMLKKLKEDGDELKGYMWRTININEWNIERDLVKG